MANILFLGTGTQTLAVLRPLAKAGHNIYIVAIKHGNYADKSRFVKKVFYTEIEPEEENFLELVKKVIIENSIDTLIPAGDSMAMFVSLNSVRLESLVKIKAPNYETFLRGYDKNKLMSLCAEKGYPHPETIDMSVADIEDASTFASFPFPGILKPNCTTGGRGMTIINGYEDLKRIYPIVLNNYGECHLQRFVKEGGHQVKVQLYIDEEGRLVASSVLDKVRWYPVKGGSSCCAVSVKNDKIVDICHNVLKEIGWVGFADFDTIEDSETNELLLMEMNPRIPACIGAAIKAGINWGQIILDGNLGNPQLNYTYETGHVLRHIGFDMLWFIKSPNRFRTKPSWFHFFGKKISYQDFDIFDMKPFFVGSYHNIKKIINPSFKRAKNGTSKI